MRSKVSANGLNLPTYMSLKRDASNFVVVLLHDLAVA